ncbi:hypothetical protein MCOR27_011196 [Pyricularia oryzae]|uniref:Uncharacterized protein n=1 Tax=Pyricularia grisea TaxID=148305 RepID=A0ABQ8N4B3_PYRGI|nr:hypothetical protein MCOR01_005591 [Pyricularia oryzae]KAI6290712.1 hypothetical protein MCOR33_011101 [Pyricularia grisea]KAI6261248.1 hypothetical protein MCOR19_002547 [Pyricularia oryzae]KAI6265995.1 hypothetical protein MCOR27_011196 [Pyricularia oryzae]KAI6267239.1 hypothetical protein MCOR26_009811 [Pyricularia oryzae]
MGIEDLFEFSKREYAQHVALKTDAELKQHEIRKTQQLFSTTYTISAGIAATALTCGASLGAAALGGRKYYIAQAKLKMIEDELTKRNIKLHQLRKRDAIKPLIVHLVGAGVGFGVHDVLLSATTTLPLHGQLPQDAYEQLTQYATANPGHAVHATVDGALHGMREQLRETAATATKTTSTSATRAMPVVAVVTNPKITHSSFIWQVLRTVLGSPPRGRLPAPD